MLFMNIRECVNSKTPLWKWWSLTSKKKYSFPLINLYLTYVYVFTTKCMFLMCQVFIYQLQTINFQQRCQNPKWLPIPAVNCGDKNCSRSIINYVKAFSTTINMTEPIFLLALLREMIISTTKIDQTWTLQGLFQNVGRGKWQETK